MSAPRTAYPVMTSHFFQSPTFVPLSPLLCSRQANHVTPPPDCVVQEVYVPSPPSVRSPLSSSFPPETCLAKQTTFLRILACSPFPSGRISFCFKFYHLFEEFAPSTVLTVSCSSTLQPEWDTGFEQIFALPSPLPPPPPRLRRMEGSSVPSFALFFRPVSLNYPILTLPFSMFFAPMTTLTYWPPRVCFSARLFLILPPHFPPPSASAWTLLFSNLRIIGPRPTSQLFAALLITLDTATFLISTPPTVYIQSSNELSLPCVDSSYYLKKKL